MMLPPIPANDSERVGVLRSLGVLDTPPEPDYDELTQLAAQICGVPMALITLVDAERQWFKSRIGIDDTETSRELSFCAHVICEPERELFVVADTHRDSRFADHPAVTDDPSIRFYAGAPLVTHDGWALGTLCVADREPRDLTHEQLKALSILRRHVVNALELRRVVANQNRVIAELEATRRDLDLARRTAEDAAAAKAQFLATMSHEIRTPMNAVIGMTTLLGTTSLTADQRESVDTIRSSGELLLTVINDILDFSKIEAGKLELERAPFAVADCVASAVRLIASRAAEKHLTLRTEIAPGTPAVVRGDATRTRQILVNLLSNAVKFTDRGGIVVQVAGRPTAGGRCELQFGVQDSGIGIAPDRIHKLFTPFTQADSSTTRRYGGTGLGLAISRRLAELHGGRLWAESELGRGSRFHFTLVVTPTTDAMAPAAAAPEAFDAQFAARHPARILVAEDNRVNQKVLVRTLARLGYRPALANDGRAAVTAVTRERFDLVLMDVEMPELDGPGATREIRARLPAQQQPVIVAATAHVIAGNRENYMAAGMDEYLTKPIRLEDLTALLARLPELRRSRAA